MYLRANGQAECYVQTIKKAIVKYVGALEAEGEWQAYLPEVLLALRCLVHCVHGHTPFLTVHGVKAELPSFLGKTASVVDSDMLDEDKVVYVG